MTVMTMATRSAMIRWMEAHTVTTKEAMAVAATVKTAVTVTQEVVDLVVVTPAVVTPAVTTQMETTLVMGTVTTSYPVVSPGAGRQTAHRQMEMIRPWKIR